MIERCFSLLAVSPANTCVGYTTIPQQPHIQYINDF